MILVGEVEPAGLWDTLSYVDYAHFVKTNTSLPPIGIRTPICPLFILNSGLGWINPAQSVLVQRFLGILSACLVYLGILHAMGRISVAIAAAIVFSLFIGSSVYGGNHLP